MLIPCDSEEQPTVGANAIHQANTRFPCIMLMPCDSEELASWIYFREGLIRLLGERSGRLVLKVLGVVANGMPFGFKFYTRLCHLSVGVEPGKWLPHSNPRSVLFAYICERNQYLRRLKYTWNTLNV